MDREQDELFEALEEAMQARDGYLYVFHAEGTRFIKIGYATDVAERRAYLQVGCPQKLHILYTVASTDAPALERLMHDHFIAYHVHGDWFQLPDDVPTTLSLLAFLYRQSPSSLGPRAYNPLSRTILTTEVIALLSQHGPLSVAELRNALGSDRIASGTLRVQLHRLHKAGMIGKLGRGRYAALAGPEEELLDE